MKLVNQITNCFAGCENGEIWPAYNSTGGAILQDGRIELVFEKALFADQSRVALCETQLVFGAKKRLHSLEVSFLKEIAGWIDTMYMTGDYRKVLQQPNWQTLFQVSQRLVSYVHGTTPHTQLEATMPCYKCGIMLPVSHITIDHQKPQTGGEAQAVLKNLRNMGYNLTHAPGVGGVATAYISGLFQALPTKSGGGHEPLDPDHKPERYTLTDRGITFLSAAIAASGEQRVIDLCMHSAFNLKPYCAKCNIGKSNVLTDLSWIND